MGVLPPIPETENGAKRRGLQRSTGKGKTGKPCGAGVFSLAFPALFPAFSGDFKLLKKALKCFSC